jgi:hypothetical protein
MTATVHTFPRPADPPGLIEARAAFRSPDHMPLDVLDTAAAVLRHSPHADDRLIARAWGNRLAEQMLRDRAIAELLDELRPEGAMRPGWWIAPAAACGLVLFIAGAAMVVWRLAEAMIHYGMM